MIFSTMPRASKAVIPVFVVSRELEITDESSGYLDHLEGTGACLSALYYIPIERKTN